MRGLAWWPASATETQPRADPSRNSFAIRIGAEMQPSPARTRPYARGVAATCRANLADAARARKSLTCTNAARPHVLSKPSPAAFAWHQNDPVSTFETVLISACTSAGVALAVEWAAKPRLEARKERILEVHRSRREVIRALRTITTLGGQLEYELPAGMDGAARALAIRHLEDRRADAARIGRELETDATGFYMSLRNVRARAVLSLMTGVVQGIAISGKPRQQAGRELSASSGPVLDYFARPWWQPRSRRAALRKAEAILGVHGSSNEPMPAAPDPPPPAESG